MKTLIVIRHAKSSWAQPGVHDFDRPLNERGNIDAPKMTTILAKKELKIDILITSPAKRAMATAKIFLEELGLPRDKLIEIPALYLAPVKTFYREVASFKDDWEVALLFSHNPGVTDFVNSFDCMPIYNMPTCGMYGVQIAIDSWENFEIGKKHFLFFEFPKGAQ
ncbi:MAG: histidine phosphatase family protein [Bacteroidetes bacterium]|nr:histidine phosphatase family protein [Bacteroidota bacterium]